jgi:hypothetical protein
MSIRFLRLNTGAARLVLVMLVEFVMFAIFVALLASGVYVSGGG